MTRYVFRRLGGAIIILWVIITVTFALMHAIPGGPFTTEKKLPPQVKASIEAKYHLDDPVWKQYGDYLGGVITADLGPSFKYEGRSVNDIIGDAFPISAQLGLLSLMVAIVGGITAGAISAMRPNSIAFIARLTRSGLLDVYQQEYIRTARAKGLGSWTILTRHALGNAILPVITYLGPLAASLLTGSFIVETIFAIPGLGQYFVTSIYNRDYTVILGITIFYSALVVFLNILVDMIYPLIDPRVTTEEGTDE